MTTQFKGNFLVCSFFIFFARLNQSQNRWSIRVQSMNAAASCSVQSHFRLTAEQFDRSDHHDLPHSVMLNLTQHRTAAAKTHHPHSNEGKPQFSTLCRNSVLSIYFSYEPSNQVRSLLYNHVNWRNATDRPTATRYILQIFF